MVDYWKVGLIIAIGAIIWFAITQQYGEGAGNIIAFFYVLAAIKIYQLLGEVEDMVGNSSHRSSA